MQHDVCRDDDVTLQNSEEEKKAEHVVSSVDAFTVLEEDDAIALHVHVHVSQGFPDKGKCL